MKRPNPILSADLHGIVPWVCDAEAGPSLEADQNLPSMRSDQLRGSPYQACEPPEPMVS